MAALTGSTKTDGIRVIWFAFMNVKFKETFHFSSRCWPSLMRSAKERNAMSRRSAKIDKREFRLGILKAMRKQAGMK
jgi:hypothetical protein